MCLYMIKYNKTETTKEKEKEKEKKQIKMKFLFDLTSDSIINQYLDNTFIIFESKKTNIVYLIYSGDNKSINTYNINSFSNINTIKNAHDKEIINFRHHYYKEEKKDLVMSISFDNNIKIWDIINFYCIFNLKNINNNGGILSASFLIDNNNTFILTSNYNRLNSNEPLKIYKFNGTKIKNIKDSDETTYFVDTYKDKNQSKLYIIAGHNNYIKSYDYLNNQLYHKYYEYDNTMHWNALIYSHNGIVSLIDAGSEDNGIIRIWNFHSGLLLKKINIEKCAMGMSLWNEDYLFVGCIDSSIKIIDLKSGLLVNSYKEHKSWICTIKIIKHNKFDYCLISQSMKKDSIKLWKIYYI